MYLLFLLVLQNLFHFGQTLISCNETVLKLQLCTLVSDYEKGYPDSIVHCPDGCQSHGHGQPTQIKTSITLFSLDEFNEDKSTISLKVLIALFWNDTRLSLPQNFPDNE